MQIIVAIDQQECASFVHWLRTQGIEALVGDATGNYVDGVWTSTDEDCNEVYRDLWDRYCSS